MSPIRSLPVLHAVVMLALGSSARAQVLVDFGNLAPGTVVTNQYPEVTFSSSAGNVNYAFGATATTPVLCSGLAGGPVTCIADTYLDFTSPVSNLTFLAIEANCACIDARFRVFQGGVHTATVDLVGLGSTGNVPVDLSAYANITRLEIVGILDDPILENGIGWDEFRFTPTPGTTICTGDGAGAACPCGNLGAVGRGCGNSVDPAGGQLVTTGSASLSGDALLLSGSGMPNGSAVYLQGTSTLGGGLGIQFGDGLRCVAGAVTRLKVVQNVGGTSQYPQPGDLSVSVRGNVLSPGVRVYQIWYRNGGDFCTPSTFNLTNGSSITWTL